MRRLHGALGSLLTTLLLLLMNASATASESRVDLGSELTGAWTKPDSDWNGRTLLLFHGFADDMDGAGDLMKRLAAELATNGIASLRINFRGFVTLASYPGAFLSVRGTEDFLPQHEMEFLKLAKGRPSDAILIGGADHIFNVFQHELGHANRVVTQTIDWVQRVL